MDRHEDTGRWTGGLGSLRALGSELSALVRVVGALPWRSLADALLNPQDRSAASAVAMMRA